MQSLAAVLRSLEFLQRKVEPTKKLKHEWGI